eukprot:171597_1
MGLGSSNNKSSKISKTNALQYYETSTESWVFNERHVKAIKNSLKTLQLTFTTNIILSYLGNINTKTIFKWNHPNYTTFIHPKRTPLNNDTSPLDKDWLNLIYRKGGSNHNNINIIMLGGGGVGKSSITIRFISDQFLDEYDPTIEDSYRKQITLNVPKDRYDKRYGAPNGKYSAQDIEMDILDTAGREEFSAMLDQWFRMGQIFCLVFSVVYSTTFDEVKIIRERILRCRDDDDDYAIVVVGNKCDLRVDGNVSKYDYGGRSGMEVNMDEVHEWCSEMDLPYIETSAKDGKNINFLYRQAVYELYEKTKHLGVKHPTKKS